MAEIGLIGLAVMGANLARNISSKGFNTVVFNRTAEKLTEYIQEFGGENLSGAATLEEFVKAIDVPRKIIVMVKAGEPVDAVIKQLVPLLDKGDCIIDCGNSNYNETIRRGQDLSEKGIRFIGCGVSGGEEGALNGPSLMPGGSEDDWHKMKNIWDAIAAKDFQGNPCVTNIGADGAGHYVKMVHNGIEYGVMQIIAEAYDLLKRVYKLSPDQIAGVFEKFNQGRLESFLLEIAIPVLRKKDEESGYQLIDIILDKADQKGTGKWTVVEALERGVGLSTISEAVFARVNSSYKEKRQQLAQYFVAQDYSPEMSLEDFTAQLEHALYAGIISAYAQGFELIKLAAEEQHWRIDLSEVTRIWQGGCILRARLLEFLTYNFKSAGTENSHLFELPGIQDSLKSALPAWRTVVTIAVTAGVPTPALTAGLHYIDTMTSARLPANMIQGLRDYFGAHTYQRTDKEGMFHTDWI